MEGLEGNEMKEKMRIKGDETHMKGRFHSLFLLFYSIRIILIVDKI